MEKHSRNDTLNHHSFPILMVKRGEPCLVLPEKETPKELYFLSNLDQNKVRMNPKGAKSSEDPQEALRLLTSLEDNIGMVVSTIYCYKSDSKGNESAARMLKASLSKVLVPYYPFAGRLAVSTDGKLIVDCRGEGGAIFVEAEAGCNMEDIGDLTMPDQTNLGQLVYTFPGPKTILDIPPFMAQVTKFSCGGFVLGLSMNHALCDGVSSSFFMRSWGEVARGLSLQEPPFLDRTLLSSRNPPKIEFDHPEYYEMTNDDDDDDCLLSNTIKDRNMIMKGFLLGNEALEKIKLKVLEEDSGNFLNKCTSFEALSGFVWRARTQALGYKPKQKVKLVFPIDGRRRYSPPLPKASFGNAICMATCICSVGELIRNPISFTVKEVQKAIMRIDDQYMRSAIDYYEVTRARTQMRSTLLITQWARDLLFQETDFGWGEPVHSGPISFPGNDVIMFLPSGKENGRENINLLLRLPEEAMNSFEKLLKDILPCETKTFPPSCL